jgi:hypothetical protein
MNIVAFNLQYLSPSYKLRCLGFFLAGLARLKLIPFALILKENVETKYSSYATTFMYSFVFMVLFVFCTYVEYISKNAIWFLHFTNASSIICIIVFYSISVDSPLRLIRQGDERLAMQNLNYIARFNSFFTRKAPYIFDGSVKIVASQKELVHFKLQEKVARLFI